MLNKLRLLTPGPTPLPEEVRLALARDMIHHRKADFRAMMNRVQTKLQQLFGTTEPVLPLACSGTGAMTAAVGAMFVPGQRVLVIESGKFGERWSAIAASADLEVIRLPVQWGEPVQPEAVSKALAENTDIAGVLVQVSETSTGVLNPVAALASIAHTKGALLIADGISAVGISPCPMDEWQIDCLLTGSQKGLMLPPGLALLALSRQAWAIADKIRPRCYYFNLTQERLHVLEGQTNFTSPVNLIAGLDASLDFLLAGGLKAVYHKQWALVSLVRAGVSAMGLAPFAATDFTWGLTSVQLPDGIDAKKLLDFCQKEYGIVMAGGQDQLKGRIIRIGHMGWVDWGDCMAALCAIAQGLQKLGFTPQDGFERAALTAYKQALANF